MNLVGDWNELDELDENQVQTPGFGSAKASINLAKSGYDVEP